ARVGMAQRLGVQTWRQGRRWSAQTWRQGRRWRTQKWCHVRKGAKAGDGTKDGARARGVPCTCRVVGQFPEIWAPGA
ncbi:hypothetical protein HAX54_042359, partial [Datura stramonium]|nr:hypothetical protein [Datura stramonium]